MNASHLGAAAATFLLCAVTHAQNPAPAPNLEKLFEKHTFTGRAGSLPYRLLKPDGYAEEGADRYPLVIYLHGMGERGVDNRIHISFNAGEFATDTNRRKYPCFVAAPQCPPDDLWRQIAMPEMKQNMPLARNPAKAAAAVLELIDALLRADYRVDPDRVYLTGISIGGYGTWDLIVRRPEIFAAAIPVCGGGDPARARALAGLPLWAFHGDQDQVVPVARSRDMIAAIQRAGGTPKYTEYKGVGHDSWTATYKDPEVMEWLFRQRRSRAR